MLYSVLIFGVEGVAERLPPEEHEALLDMHRALQEKLQAEGTYRGSVQLMPPSTAMTVANKGSGVTVLDGPFAESKEQILGLYLIECDTVEEALEAAKSLPLGVATMEVRPVRWTGGL